MSKGLLEDERLLAALRGVLSKHGIRAWLVGGTVRDRELGRQTTDIDVVVEREVGAVAREVADKAGLSCFTLSEKFNTHRIAAARAHLDLTAMRGGSMEADLAKRDFTVNAMALSLEDGHLLDPHGGRADLAARRLAPVGEGIFEDDPLRLLRAARMVHTFAFALGTGLRGKIREEGTKLERVAPERVLSEMVLTLEAGRSSAAVSLWDDLGLLEVMFPEIAVQKGVGQSAFHHLDVFGHTLEAMSWTDEILTDLSRWFPRSAPALQARFALPVDGMMSRSVALRLAVLLHDVAKPQTRAVDPQGRVLFWGHTQLGVTMAAEIARRLRLSREAALLIGRVVEEHLAVGFLQHEKPLSPRSEIKYLWATAPFEPEVIIASVADRLAARGPLVEERFISGHIAVAEQLMERWRRRAAEAPPPPPIDGHDLMEELGLAPGPHLGCVVREVRLAWEAGEVTSREEALAAARAAMEAAEREPAV